MQNIKIQKSGADKDVLLPIVIENKSSDLYITAGTFPATKISGEIVSIENENNLVLTPEDTEAFANSIMNEDQKEKFREHKEWDFSYDFEGKARFRVNVFLQQHKIGVVMRYLPNKIPTLPELHLPEIFTKILSHESGIILVAGPTGHGKSTTLAAMLDHINTHKKQHIVTIEDPIEYVHPHKMSIIEQREVGVDTDSFAAALRSALRQNPNVVLLGEMRDLESIAQAITIAETGHLVLATIHAHSAAQCVNKIIDSFPANQQNQIRVQLSQSLLAIFSQRLLRRKDEGGMVVATEAMIRNSGIGSLIRENQTHQINSAIQMGRSEGMHLLEESLITLAAAGKISIEDAMLHANNPDVIKKAMQG